MVALNRIGVLGSIVLAALVFSGCRTGAPDAPDAFEASAGDSRVSLAWQAPLHDGGRNVSGYVVRAEPGAIEQRFDETARGFDVSGLSNGTLYTFTVSAINEVGEGEPAHVDVTPARSPGAPSNVVASAGVNQATLTWSAPGNGGAAISGYVITPYVGSSAETPTVVSGAIAQATVMGLTRGTTYSFRVAAQNIMGVGETATSNAVTTPDFPTAPGNVSGVRGNGQVQVSWTAPGSDGGAPLTGYFVSAYVGANVAASASVGAGVTSTPVTGLVNGTAYTFRVAALNGVGTGPASAASSSVTPASEPAAPTQVVAHAGNVSATIRWQAPADGGDAISSYTVTASPGGATASTSTTSLTFTSLTNAQSYTFSVKAINSVGTGPPSSASKTVIPGPTPAHCQGALAQNPGADSDVFTIAPFGAPLSAYCDMTTSGGGWTLVYKLSSGIDVGNDISALWTSATPLNESNAALLDVTADSAHYLSSIVTDGWNTNGRSWAEARVAVYEQGVEHAFVEFDASSSTRTNWFALAHVTSATWSDLADGQNFFSIDGDWAVQRNWFINYDYQTCSGDTGWLVVSTGGMSCVWENTRGAPVRILYAPGGARANWTTEAALADVLAVFVR